MERMEQIPSDKKHAEKHRSKYRHGPHGAPRNHQHKGPLTAPLTGKPAVAYTYSIQREDRDDDDDESNWDTIRSGQDTTTCTLKDNTGTVAINLDDSLEDGDDFYERTHSFDDPSPQLKQRLDELNVNYEGWFGGNYDMKFKETRIEPGTEVYLLGTARDNPGVEDGTATESAEDILIEASDNPFLISKGDEASLRSGTKWKAFGLVALSVTLIVGTISYIVIV